MRAWLRPGTGARRSKACRAFTLIELMVVIVLMAILSAMILPEMRGSYDDALLRASGRKLVNALGLAYSRAVSSGQILRFHFDRRTGRYVLESESRDGEQGARFSPVKDLPDAAGEIDSRIAVEITRPEDNLPPTGNSGAPLAAGGGFEGAPRPDALAFYPDGTADAGEILLRDREGFRLALRINPITARVGILEEEK